MNRTHFVGCLLAVLGSLLNGPLDAAETTVRDEASEVTRVADFIDRCIDEQLGAAKVMAAPLSDDAEFLRRVYLDIAGRVPPVAEVRLFLNDSSPDKRRDLVNRLLESPRYPIHSARRWRSVWLPPGSNNGLLAFHQMGFENWLRSQFANDVSYSQLVAQLLTLPVINGFSRVNDLIILNGGSGASSFFATRQLDRNEIAAAVARTMLGVRIECAQCHDHPFDVWRQNQFHSFAALFDGVADLVRVPGGRVSPSQPSLAKPVFLDGTAVKSKDSKEILNEVTQWMTAPENQFFARAAVNRLWQDFFGMGIVDPVDDFSDHNPPSHPRLLDGLSHEFVAHQYDLKFLIRSIAATRAYQRTSRISGAASDPRLFAHSKVRALTADQLWDTLEQLTGFSAQPDPREALINPISSRSEFRRLFNTGAASTSEQSTTILQALALMNGQTVTEATTFARGAILSAVVDYPGLTTDKKIETLYLATLSRPPLPQELARSITFVTEGSNVGLLSDILWALMNSSEFVTNH